MTEPLDLSEDLGTMEVKLPGGQIVRLDLWQAHMEIRAIQETTDCLEKGTPLTKAFYAGLPPLFVELGFPPMSQISCHKIVTAVWNRLNELTKKNDAPSGSPDSSETSPPST